MRSLLSFLAMVAVTVAAMQMGGALHGFVDLSSIALLIGVTVAGTLTTFSFREFGSGIGKYFSSDNELGREEAHLGGRLFRRMSIMASGAGLMGALLGQLEFLHVLDDPTKLGPAMAVTLLSVFYAVMVGELMFGSMATDCLSRGGLVGIAESPKSYSNVRSFIGLTIGTISIGQVVVLISHLPQ